MNEQNEMRSHEEAQKPQKEATAGAGFSFLCLFVAKWFGARGVLAWV